MADGPLFTMWPPAQPDSTPVPSPAATFAQHAERFTQTCDGLREVCAGRAASDSETLRTQGELLVLELKRSARELHDSLRQGVESSDQANNKVDGVAVRVRRPHPRCPSSAALLHV